MNPPIRILHLSDIHFRLDKAWDQDPVMRALVWHIAKEVESGLAPDLLAFTGDLAFSGTAEEYAMARKWLEEQLWPALPEGFPRDHLLLVPGNHDVDRNRVGKGVKHMQDGLLDEKSQDTIAELLKNGDEREIMLKRHTAYLEFLGNWLGETQTLPWWQRLVDIRGTRLHVAGLDSAWMACGDKGRDRLLLGRYQINQTVLNPVGENAAWRIALLHHPFDYFAEFDGHECRQSLHQHCDILLRGHLHETEVFRVVPPDPSRACLELAAGCVYQHGRYPNSFQWIELHSEPRKVRVLFRTWIKGAWVIDHNQTGCRKGHADFLLDTPNLTRANGTKNSLQQPTLPPIPSEYLAWLQRHHACVELLGQDVQQGRSVTLNQVYVPAVTLPAVPPTQGQPSLGKETQPPALLLQRIDQSSLYCPAPPGAGKSTFCRWAALQSIPGSTYAHPVPAPEGFQEPLPVELRKRLPLLVPLREFWRGMDCGHGRREWHREDLEQALSVWVDRSPPDGLNGALLRNHLAAGTAFLLLDGLDEVPLSEPRDGIDTYPRALLLSGLADALPAWEKSGNRTLLTSRPYGLDEASLARLGLTRAPLEPIPKPLQTLFATRWFHTLDRPELAQGLLQTIAGREDLAPLAETPMLLTALCVIYGNGRRLPEDRYHLYQRIVDNVLFNRYPGDARQREPVKARLEAVALGMHSGEEPHAVRLTPAAEVGEAEVERLLRDFAKVNPAYESGRVGPAVQREELLARSGLLLPRAGNRAAFYHLSFQEFLAAERIARTCEDRQAFEQVFRSRGGVPEWRPTLLFLFAAQVFNYRDAQWGLDLLAKFEEGLGRADIKANPSLAVFLAEALELCQAKKYQVTDTLAENFRKHCLEAIEDDIEVHARQSLGLCLGRLGDPRIKDLRDPAGYIQIPAETYPYGEKAKKTENTRIASPFLLARYPVTNSQYQVFMEDKGYEQKNFWSDEGWDWLQQQASVSEPRLWQDRRWNGPNQPVVGVSYWEAEACCRWAGGRLPKEREWESAARGSKGYEYPWGGEWEDGICNSAEAGLNVTSPVGLFPRSRQASFGLDDMAGNVWEWCDDYWDKSGANAPRVLRGGAFDGRSWFLRSSDRYWVVPVNWGRGVGFRCVLAPPRQP